MNGRQKLMNETFQMENIKLGGVKCIIVYIY